MPKLINLDPYYDQAYVILPQLKYSIKGWNKELYSWVYVRFLLLRERFLTYFIFDFTLKQIC